MTGNNITQQTIFNYLNEKILPHVNNGVIQSKTYIIDLIHRSVNYLIIHDIILFAIGLLLFIISICGMIWILKKTHKLQNIYFEDHLSNLFALLIIVLIVSLIFIYINAIHLIQDFVVPELRLYHMYLGSH